MVHQVHRRLRHAPGAAQRAEASALAAERHQLVLPAVTTMQTQRTAGQDAAFEEGVEFVFGRTAAGRRRLPSPPARKRWRRAAAPSGTAWSARGGGVRSQPGRCPAPCSKNLAAGQRLAHEAPNMVTLDCLKPRAVPQSPCVDLHLNAPCCRDTFRGLGAYATGRFGATISRQPTTPVGRPLPIADVGYRVAQLGGQLSGGEIAGPTVAGRPKRKSRLSGIGRAFGPAPSEGHRNGSCTAFTQRQRLVAQHRHSSSTSHRVGRDRCATADGQAVLLMSRP